MGMFSRNLRGYASAHILATLALFTVVPAAHAQKADTPVFIPASTWQVGATQLSSVRGIGSVKMPCVLSNEFDNGYVVRFSGGGGEIMAMAVDFRQDAFRQGRKYNAMLSVGDGYVKQVEATAFTSSTLIFNLRPIKDFYNVVREGNTLGIDIDGNAMEFTLGELKTAYGDFEACYSGKKTMDIIQPMPSDMRTAGAAMPGVPAPRVESAQAAPQNIVPPAPSAMQPLPKSFDEIVQNSDAANMPSAPNMKVAAPGISMTWNAKAGENMQDVLARWANNAGYDLEWQADQGGIVAQDITLNGSFEEAVSQLMAENGAATGIDAHVQTAKGVSSAAIGAASTRPDPVPAVASAPVLGPDEWQASPGANIQTVLDQWAGRAGVHIVWQDYMSVPVKSPVHVKGKFEDAVMALLDQYGGDASRPVAELNIDPKTGQRTLLMSMDNPV